jgi:hypothetical protein
VQPDEEFHDHGALSQGMEVDEAPVEGDAAPFSREDVIMTIFGRHPSLEKRRMLGTSMGTPAHGGQGWGDMEI